MQIQLLLKLNNVAVAVLQSDLAYSNTTLVKVKLKKQV